MSLPALSNNNTNFMIAPQNLTEAMNFAKMIADSSLCPPNFKNKPGDVIIAMQMGAEVGLSPMQALQNIAVINNRPCLWGDAALAVVQASCFYVAHDEWFEGTEKEGNLTAYCAITRKGQKEYIKTFSQQEAIKAGLWKKPGVWQQYPSRMLQMRARAFALRDKFSDALRGLQLAEEVSDYQVVDIKAERLKAKPIKQINVIQQTKVSNDIINEDKEDLEIQFVEFKELLTNCDSEQGLKELFDHIKKANFRERPDLFKQLIDLKDIKKKELLNNSINEFIDGMDATDNVKENKGETNNA